MQKHSLKNISFYLILFTLPFIILLLIEIALRLANFGQSIPLFIDKASNSASATAHFLQPNPKVINRYFADEKLAPNVSPDTVYFNKVKAENSYRIIIQGGSTAAGFPYGRWGSLQGMLEQRFKRLYPTKEIEIINTAMAAVNSYTLLDFVDEIIEQQPDLVLIYTGHNEYLGVMGVGSAFAAKGGRLATLMHLKFKALRLYQLLQWGYTQFFLPENALNKTNTQHDRSLMSKVAKETEIVINSDLYQQGLIQFEQNLSMILQQYQNANIPVIIGNLVSNESGQTPFSTVGKVDWHSYKTKLNKNNAASNIVELLQQLKAAGNGEREDSIGRAESAEVYYKLGLNYQKLGQFPQAKKAFIAAKDHDLLRFRAPSQFNQIIKTLAKQHHATFIDTLAYFNANSPEGIIGNSLILEHLHPTLEGYFLLAEAFNDKITTQQLLGAPVEPNTATKEKAYQDIPVSRVDKLYGDLKITQLMQDYPFTPAKINNNSKQQKSAPALPTTNALEKSALIKRINKSDWLTLQKQLLVEYQKQNDIAEAAKIAGLIATAMKDNHRAFYVAGQLYQQQQDWQLAGYYHWQATQLQPSNHTYFLALAQDYFLQSLFERSLATLEQALIVINNNNNTKTKQQSQKQQVMSYINNVKKAQSRNNTHSNKPK